ncbi:MAG: hypothetical protein ACOH5I_00445 [Oligoflexus sp.]
MKKSYLTKLALVSSGLFMTSALSAGSLQDLTSSKSVLIAENQPNQQTTRPGTQPGAQQTQQAEQQHQEQKRMATVAVDFEANQHNLSQEARDKIRSKLQEHQASAQMDTTTQDQTATRGTASTEQKELGEKIASIRVAAWSDQEFNAEQDLPEQAQELAKNRADAVEKFINDELKVDADVTAFNMAEQAGLLARTFNTQEAELKSIFARRGAEPQSKAETDNPELIHMRDEGGPSKAVVVITYEDNK